ncbi:MAG: Fur family transcriptional regulator [bacterium]
MVHLAGKKQTPQRKAILDYLTDNRQHPSAEDIFHAVKKKFPGISFATVYNTLQALKESGTILELQIDHERRRYDPYPEQHHHLICMECRKIADIHADFELNIPNHQQQGFHIFRNSVQFHGLCRDCVRKKRKAGSK